MYTSIVFIHKNGLTFHPNVVNHDKWVVQFDNSVQHKNVKFSDLDMAYIGTYKNKE